MEGRPAMTYPIAPEFMLPADDRTGSSRWQGVISFQEAPLKPLMHMLDNRFQFPLTLH